MGERDLFRHCSRTLVKSWRLFSEWWGFSATFSSMFKNSTSGGFLATFSSMFKDSTSGLAYSIWVFKYSLSSPCPFYTGWSPPPLHPSQSCHLCPLSFCISEFALQNLPHTCHCKVCMHAYCMCKLTLHNTAGTGIFIMALSITFSANAVSRESDTRFSPSGFFHKSVSLGPLNIPLGLFRIFSKIRGDIHEWMFVSGVNAIGEKREKIGDKIFLNILSRA